MKKYDLRKVERLVEFVLDVNEISEDDCRVEQIFERVKKIIENEKKIRGCHEES
jgi:hypothetical protein